MPETRTVISTEDDRFLIDGSLTYPGRSWRGKSIEGLLFNSRMANAIIDDENPATRGIWSYLDGDFTPERNTREFVAALPDYHAHGLRAVSINLQGGSPQGYSWNQPWHTSGFRPDGTIKDDYLRRLDEVIAACDRVGMIIILGLFYWKQSHVLADEPAVRNAVTNVVDYLVSRGARNVLLEIGNEVDLPYAHSLIGMDRCHELVELAQERSSGKTIKRYAEQFMRETPQDPTFDAARYCQGLSIGDALFTATMTPSNVLGADVYTDGKGHFWGDIFFKRGPDGVCQIGIPEDSPVSTQDEAEQYLRNIFSKLPLMHEHPLVEILRESGIDPETANVLRIDRWDGLTKLVMRTDSDIEQEAIAFVTRIISEGANIEHCLPSAIEQAQQVILNDLAQLHFSMPAIDSNRALREAASFLLFHGIHHVTEPSKARKLAA